MWRGLEQAITRQAVQINKDESNTLTVSSLPLAIPEDWKHDWQSADVHVHMNYGGTYRNTPERMVAQAEAEDLDLVFNVIVNKEQRIPDIGYFSSAPDAASNDRVLLLHGTGVSHQLLGAPRFSRSGRSFPAARLLVL